MTHARTILLWGVLALIGSLGPTSGCGGEEGPGKLFDEQGSWSMTRYDLDGMGFNEVDTMNREDAFMMKFESDRSVVTTASCVDVDGGAVTPADSPCLRTPGDTSWVCQCFGYAFEEDQMKWVEFEAGGSPPVVSFEEGDGSNVPPPADDGATGGASGDGSGGGGESGTAPMASGNIVVSEVTGTASTYQFARIPAGVFGSNGQSRYVFQRKADSLFDRAYDDPEGRPSCEPCI